MSARGMPPAFPVRQWQARRSTFVGTADGRVANAYPLPPLAAGRTLPGGAVGATPAYRYVAADAGPAGTVVATWPGRRGPQLLTPDWLTGQPLGVVNADGSVTWDWAGTSTYERSQLFTSNDDTSRQGVATGFTVMMAFQMPADPGPPALAGDTHDHATAIDLWLGSGDSSEGALYGGLIVVVRNNRHSTALGDADDEVQGYASASTFINYTPEARSGSTSWGASGGGPISTGSPQFLEVGATVGATPYGQLDGEALPVIGSSTVAVGPWRMREPVIDVYGAAGREVKIWEVVMFGKALPDDALTYWRGYFASAYGVSA